MVIHLRSVLFLAATAAIAASACGAPPADPTGGSATTGTGDSGAAARFKVAVARFQHQTCTFCPGGDMGIDDSDAIQAAVWW